MDRKSIIILVLSFGLLMLWYPLVNRLFPPQSVPVDTNAVGSATTLLPSEAAAPTTNAPPPRPVPVLSAAPAEAVLAPASSPEQTLTLETEQVRYTFTSHGGGLKSAELLKYFETVGRQARKPGHSRDVATLNTGAPVPVLAVLGGSALQGDDLYRLERTPTGVRAEKQLPGGLRLVKEFTPGTNFLLGATVRFENPTAQPLLLPAQELVIGTATPISPYDDGSLMSVQWFDGRSDQRVQQAWFANRTLGCLPGTPRTLYTAGSSNVVWVAAQNRFFSLIAMLPTNRPAQQVVARQIDLPPPSLAEREQDSQLVAKPFGFQTAILYPAESLAAGQAVERNFDLFAGPKEYRILDRMGGRFGNRVELVMNFGGFFGFFAKALLLSMNGLHALGLSYGLAIIAITLIIKLLFWPLTQASTRSMKRMQELQPKMKEIQEKYKDDPKKVNQKTMEFMKENRLNPAAGCLPILIQIPVFFGFYTMLQSAIELRGAGFLWAFDLSQPDTIWIIPGLGLPLNPLPLLMGATQFWQMRMTPPSPGMDPVQQKIFQYMPLMFLFILYNFSSGLTLYWTVQNLLTIAQMKLTKSSAAAPARGPAAPASPAPRRKS